MHPSSLNSHLFFLPPSPTAPCGTFILTPQPAAPWRVGSGVSPIARCWRHLLNGGQTLERRAWSVFTSPRFSIPLLCAHPALSAFWPHLLSLSDRSERAPRPAQAPPQLSQPTWSPEPRLRSLLPLPSTLGLCVRTLLAPHACLPLSLISGPVFSAAHGLSLGEASRGGSSCGRVGSLWRLLLAAPRLQSVGPVGVAHGFSCSAACGIFPGRGLNLRPLHWEHSLHPWTSRAVPVGVIQQHPLHLPCDGHGSSLASAAATPSPALCASPLWRTPCLSWESATPRSP